MRSSSKQIIETALFFQNKMKYENLKNAACVHARMHVFKPVYLSLCVCGCVYVSMCVSF